jgi:flagellar biosynthetic protein FliR
MELLTERMVVFLLVASRIGAFFFAVPVFSWQTIPTQIKITITIFMAVFFCGTVRFPVDVANLSGVEMGVMMTSEIIYGLALGYVTAYVFGAVKLSARICERQMGLSMANILDPMTGESAQPLGTLMEMILILLFLSANGHHIFLMTIARSYETFPIGSIPAMNKLVESITVAGSTMLLLGLRMSAPIVAAFLLLMVVLAILARIAPETNILFLSLPLKVGLGMLMVGIFLPFISNFVKEFTGWLDKLIPM